MLCNYLVFSYLSYSWELKECELTGHSASILPDYKSQFFFGHFRAAVHNWIALSRENGD